MASGESLIPSPKIFASYAWSDERSTMVREVCERLMADGVNVLLDQWHLKEGDDVYNFMEQCVNDPTVTRCCSFATNCTLKRRMTALAEQARNPR